LPICAPRARVCWQHGGVPAAAVPWPSLEVSDRLGHDLRSRFPDAKVLWREDEYDDLWCEVYGDDYWGGFSDSWLDGEAEEPWSERDVERLLAHVAEQVGDNLWPDELTDPWPLCPVHGDHPLQPGIVSNRAVWQCLRDEAFVVRIGELTGA